MKNIDCMYYCICFFLSCGPLSFSIVQMFGRILFIQEMNGHPEEEYVVPAGNEAPAESRIWYLPHHAVFNSNKEDKLRVVLIYFCERIYFSFERLLPFVVLSVS